MPSPTHDDRIPAEHLLDCVWRLDLDLRITYVSPAAEAMFGIPAEALCGSPLADHTPDEDLARLRELVKVALSSADRTAGLLHEVRIKHADGRLIPVEIRGRVLLDGDGHPMEIIGVARDISARRDRERRDRRREQRRLESQKMDALARLAGSFVDDLEASSVGGQHDSAASTRLDQLRAIAGRLPLHREDIDLDGNLTQTLAAIRTTLPSGIDLVHQPGAGGSTIMGDLEQLEKVVDILVRRACRAVGDSGLVTVATGLRALEAAPDAPPAAPMRPWITLEVRDTGPGMDHATRERILEPFFDAAAGEIETGLDLAMVHGIVAQHDGELEIESRPGQGTTFRVVLPARFADDILAGATSSDSVRRQTILLVEDDPDVRNYCERILRAGGFDVTSCEDGVEALAVIAGGEAVDAVVLDWALPGLDGRRVREQIARRQPDLPLLVISGHASKDYEALGGVDSETPWLAKPFTPPVLLAAVKKLLPDQAEAPGS